MTNGHWLTARVDECRLSANPQTKPTDLGCESTNKWLLPSTSTIAVCYYYSARMLILIFTVPRRVEG